MSNRSRGAGMSGAGMSGEGTSGAGTSKGTDSGVISETELRAELRATVDGAGAGQLGGLADGALHLARRGQRVRTTVVAASVLVVALGASGGIWAGQSGSSPTASAGVADSPTVETGTPSTKPTAAASPGTTWMPAYMVRTFKSLLPAGARTVPGMDGHTITAHAPELAPSGRWGSAVSSGVKTADGNSSVSVQVSGHKSEAHCPSRPAAHEKCTTTARDGGTVIVYQGFKDSEKGTGDSFWDVWWNGPEGQSVSVEQATSTPARTHEALTTEQLTAMALAPGWDRVWKALPEPCPWGAMPGEPEKGQSSGTGVGGVLVCATSKGDAIHLPADARG